MTEHIALLKPEIRDVLTPESYAERVPDGVDTYVEPFARQLDIGPLCAVVEEAMRRFAQSERVASDKWLAPRVHATLRLDRREAADRRLWDYLSIVALRDYVIWRWGNDQRIVDMKRITGPHARHALGRLWWAAELSRNGSDYSSTVEAFEVQNTVEFLNYLRAFNNRAAAIAFVRFLSVVNSGQRARSDQVPLFAKRMNHVLTTIVLDALAPDGGLDGDAISEWKAELPDETTMYDVLPQGPKEQPVDDAKVAAVEQVLTRIAAQIPSAKPVAA